MWPVAGMFCRGGVCGPAAAVPVVIEMLSSGPGLDEEGLLLGVCWCSWFGWDWPEAWLCALCACCLDTAWAAL